jgi:hypothetical protein
MLQTKGKQINSTQTPRTPSKHNKALSTLLTLLMVSEINLRSSINYKVSLTGLDPIPLKPNWRSRLERIPLIKQLLWPDSAAQELTRGF